MSETLVLLVWLLLLALAYPYARRVRHPEVKPLAAFLQFVMLFSLVGGSLFFALSWLTLQAGWAPALSNPLGALLFLALVFVPAVLVARWVIRRPPWNRPVPK
jgi:hypothetical protein